MLYSCSPRGSARPTSWIDLPLSGPSVRHLATCDRRSFSGGDRSDESKSNFGALSELSTMPHADRMSSEMFTAEFGFGFGASALVVVVAGAGVRSVWAALGGGNSLFPPHAPSSGKRNARAIRWFIVFTSL